jgi:hypothetical protein
VDLERGPLGLVSTIEELLGRKSSFVLRLRDSHISIASEYGECECISVNVPAVMRKHHLIQNCVLSCLSFRKCSNQITNQYLQYFKYNNLSIQL